MTQDAAGGPIADRPVRREVLERTVVHHGRVWDVVAEVVDLGETQVLREYVDHPGAVAVIAVDDDGRVLLLSQYRHPVRAELWEPPAGLLDVPGEDPQAAAARELEEEADLRAERWERLLDYRTTPGGSSETIVFFLARGLTPVPESERFVRTDEEATMVPHWLPLDDAVTAVLEGRLHSPTTVVGVLAAATLRDRAAGAA